MTKIAPATTGTFGENNPDLIDRLRSEKTRSQRNFGFLSHNSLVTALALGTFAMVLTGKILTAPKGRETEQWIDDK